MRALVDHGRIVSYTTSLLRTTHFASWSGSAGRDASLIRRSIASKAPQQCLSEFWTPTTAVGIQDGESTGSLALLTRAGLIRQSSSGIFHVLPLGLRVQNKIEALVDKHMRSLGASKVSLSSITSQALWVKSGRFSKDGTGQPELYRLRNGLKDSNAGGNRLLLAPTHEEEITKLVAGTIQTYKELPLRLYQTSRKYRNELRPRQGLLRAREFLMKDLYTFDLDHARAMKTYDEVRAAYAAFFDELRIPYLTAEADSGNMGGNLSHEYHFVTDAGEDNVISCDSCTYVANEEKAVSRTEDWREHTKEKAQPWVLVTEGGRDLIIALLPIDESEGRSPNWHAMKRIIPDAVQDVADPLKTWASYEPPRNDSNPSARKVYIIPDYRVFPTNIPQDAPQAFTMLGFPTRGHGYLKPVDVHGLATSLTYINQDPETGDHVDLLSIADDDKCGKCDTGKLQVRKAVELGHTFYLGTRYSTPLDCTVGLPADDPRYKKTQDQRVPLEMGCHGIGVSRLIGAIAQILADSTGLNWPRVIAPFEAVIIAAEGFEKEGKRLYNVLSNRGIDVALDDRSHKSMVWKLNDADTVGYPVILLVTKRSWGDHHSVEVQCRRQNRYKKNHRTEEEDLGTVVAGLLEDL